MPSPSWTIAKAQQDMRFAYLGGAPGTLASAITWPAAGLVALHYPAKWAVFTLFVGGMFIHPFGMLLAKALGRPGTHTRGNPLGILAIEVTILMLLCLPLAYAVFLFRPEWFFPAMLLVIGGRYLSFSTLYGMRMYWALGLVLALASYALLVVGASLHIGAFAGAFIEMSFAAIAFITTTKSKRNESI